MPALIDPQITPQDLDLLLQSSLAELQAFDPTRVVRRNVSRSRAVELSNILLSNWARIAEQLDKVLSPEQAAQRKAELERLDRRAWVYYAAELAAEENRSDTSRKQRRELAKRVAEHDRFLSMWAVPLFSEFHAETLRDISRGTGARDDAEDVLRLVTLFRENWGALAGQQQFVSAAYLDGAAADATKQLDLIRERQSNPGRILADAAYSLWFADYDELMQLGRYLSRRESDSLARFPGVRELGLARAGVGEVDEAPLDEADEAQGDDADEAQGDDDALPQAQDPNAAA